ncbi:AEL262Cp [Eremothecium gossypii ATCC 10895]|uniref:AEL262Cp n=1 Tax=Eremothecium gossypii (strain ATCC 10895 / CBS 109.51 / FGSC 9923 / NRRL Y-1056) TaxID=284811 RepID=Q758M4_EREGS|nr:AEL262Cp [Eremothecium gossypii ATCC 10895]AAS52422.2 AEL262Cp [Eremothecium gossypii ATCC 10895]
MPGIRDTPGRDPDLDVYLSRVEQLDLERSRSLNRGTASVPEERFTSTIGTERYDPADRKKAHLLLEGHYDTRRYEFTGSDKVSEIAYESAYNYEKTFSPKKGSAYHTARGISPIRTPGRSSNYSIPPPKESYVSSEKKYLVTEEEYDLLQRLKREHGHMDYLSLKETYPPKYSGYYSGSSYGYDYIPRSSSPVNYEENRYPSMLSSIYNSEMPYNSRIKPHYESRSHGYYRPAPLYSTDYSHTLSERSLLVPTPSTATSSIFSRDHAPTLFDKQVTPQSPIAYGDKQPFPNTPPAEPNMTSFQAGSSPTDNILPSSGKEVDGTASNSPVESMSAAPGKAMNNSTPTLAGLSTPSPSESVSPIKQKPRASESGSPIKKEPQESSSQVPKKRISVSYLESLEKSRVTTNNLSGGVRSQPNIIPGRSEGMISSMMKKNSGTPVQPRTPSMSLASLRKGSENVVSSFLKKTAPMQPAPSTRPQRSPTRTTRDITETLIESALKITGTPTKQSRCGAPPIPVKPKKLTQIPKVEEEPDLEDTLKSIQLNKTDATREKSKLSEQKGEIHIPKLRSVKRDSSQLPEQKISLPELKPVKLEPKREPSLPEALNAINNLKPALEPSRSPSPNSVAISKLPALAPHSKVGNPTALPEALTKRSQLTKSHPSPERKPSIPEALTKMSMLNKPPAAAAKASDVPEALAKVAKLNKAPPVPKRKISMPEALKKAQELRNNKTNLLLEANLKRKHTPPLGQLSEAGSVPTPKAFPDRSDSTLSVVRLLKGEQSQGDKLQHVTKARDRGPRRRLPSGTSK